MAIEARNYVQQSFSVDVALIDISNARTVGGLTDVVVNRLKAIYQENHGDNMTWVKEDNF